MNDHNRKYTKMLYDVSGVGIDSENRTGINTRSFFGYQAQFNMQDGTFPAITSKKLAWNAVVSELLWFISGSTNVNDLRATLHGEENRFSEDHKTIWDANYEAQGKALGYTDGHLGPIYGYQWRNFGGVDQLKNVIDRIRTNPECRRLIVSAWNPTEISEMALPPCHCFFQFRVMNEYLHLQVYIRSNDLFLGAPFNIASYALLQCMAAHITGYKPGSLIYTIGDAHIYHNHFDAINEYFSRKPDLAPDPPTLWLDPECKEIDDFTMDSIKLIGYKSYPTIKAEMAV